MGADQDVHFAGFHSLQNFFDLLGRPEAADHFDRERERRESLLEGFVVLEGKNGGGREHGDLLVIAQGLEGSAHRDFGLAITDVAAQQAIHGELRFHVALHVGDGLRLVLGLVVFERIFELLHPLGVGRKDVTARGLALRIELEQLVGHVLHRLAHAGFRLAPCLRAKMIQDGLRALRRTIFLHQIKPSKRNIKPRCVGVFEQHEFRRAVALVDFLQSLILPDAVLHVDNVVANLQIAEVRKKRRDFRFLPLRSRRHQVRFVEQVARPKNREMRFRQNKAVGKVSLQQRSGENVAGKIRSFVGIAFSAARAASQTIRGVVLGEHIGEALDFSRVGRGKNYLRAAADQLLNLLDHGGHRAVEARGGLRKKSGFRFSFARHRQIFEIGSGERRGFFPPAFRRQIKIGGTNQVPHAAALVRFFNAGPDFVEFLYQRFGLVENHPRVRKQVENAAVGARHRSVELPARKDSGAGVAHGLLHNLRRSRNAFP